MGIVLPSTRTTAWCDLTPNSRGDPLRPAAPGASARTLSTKQVESHLLLRVPVSTAQGNTGLWFS